MAQIYSLSQTSPHGPFPVRDLRRAVRRLRGAPGRVPDLRRPAPVRARGRPALDDHGGTGRVARQRRPPRRGADRRGHRAALRDRAADARRPRRRRQRAVGVDLAVRRGDGGGDRGVGAGDGDRALASALLLGDGRVGAPLRLPRAGARRRRALDHAPRPGDRAVVRRVPRARRPDARALRRALRRRQRARVAGRRRWRRDAAQRRHRPGHPRPLARRLHVLVSEPDPAAGRGGARDRRCARAVRLRDDPGRVVGYDRAPGREGGSPPLGRPVRARARGRHGRIGTGGRTQERVLSVPMASWVEGVWSAAAGAPPGWLALGLLCHLLNQVTRGCGWCAIVRRACGDVRRRDAVGVWVAGAGAGGVLSARGGDAVRVPLMGRRMPEERASVLTGTLVAEAAGDTLVGAAVLVLAVALGAAPALGLPGLETSLWIAAAVTASALLWLVARR